MTTSALALRYANGGQCAVIAYSNGLTSQIGDLFGTGIAGLTYRNATDRVIQVQGELFALGNQGLYRKQNPLSSSGPWELVYDMNTAPNGVDTAHVMSGIYLTEDGGVPTLVWAASNNVGSGGNLNCYKLPLVRPFTVSYVGTYASIDGQVGNATLFHNGSIYMLPAWSTGGRQVSLDPLTASGASVAYDNALTNGGFGNSYALVNGRVLYVHQQGTGTVRVYEPGHVLRASITNNAGAMPFRHVIFWPHSGNDYYIVFWNNTAGGFKVYKDTLDVWSPTDITSTVLPVGLQSGLTFGKTFVLGDRTTTPGVTEWLLGFATATNVYASSITFYKWNGEGSVMTSVPNNVGGEYSDALLDMHHSVSGEYHFIPGELDASIKSTTGQFGGMDVTFVGYGDPVVIPHGGTTGALVEGETLTGGTTGTTAVLLRKNPNGDDSALHVGGISGPGFNGSEVISGAGGSVTQSGAATGGSADKIFKLYYIDSSGNLVQGTLGGTATGGTAVRVGNEVQNIIADGVTEYTVRWSFLTDGIAIGQGVNLVPSMGV